MTYDELLNILNRAQPGDWLYSKERSTFVNRHDLDIRVARQPSKGEQAAYTEAWACRFAEPEARKVKYHLYYRDSLVEAFTLVEVDGGEAQLPLPVHHVGLVVSQKDYALAKVVNRGGRLDEYMKCCDIKVVPETAARDWS